MACNTDTIGDDQLRNDTGYWVDKTILPISKVRLVNRQALNLFRISD